MLVGFSIGIVEIEREIGMKRLMVCVYIYIYVAYVGKEVGVGHFG